MNSCKYALSLSNIGPPYAGSVSIVCEGGQSIEVNVISEGVTICTVSVPAQLLGAASYETVGTGTTRRVVLNIAGEAIQTSVSGGGGKCGKQGSSSDGTFTGGISLSGSGWS
jgi:hypothetical protein